MHVLELHLFPCLQSYTCFAQSIDRIADITLKLRKNVFALGIITYPDRVKGGP